MQDRAIDVNNSTDIIVLIVILNIVKLDLRKRLLSFSFLLALTIGLFLFIELP